MARIRTVKPEFWTAEQVMELSPLARLLFIGMWNFCDDSGVHPLSVKTLKAEIFPSDDFRAADIELMVAELVSQGLLLPYEVEGRSYWIVTGWHHQKIDQPTYKHPLPDGTTPGNAARRRSNYQNSRGEKGDRQPDVRRTAVESPPLQEKATDRQARGGEATPEADNEPPEPPQDEPVSESMTVGDFVTLWQGTVGSFPPGGVAVIRRVVARHDKAALETAVAVTAGADRPNLNYLIKVLEGERQRPVLQRKQSAAEIDEQNRQACKDFAGGV